MSANTVDLQRIITPTTTVLWLRRDLRLTDSAALYHALKEQREVLPLFIFDTIILNQLEDKEDKRVDFIYQTLANMKYQLEAMGSTLLVIIGTPAAIFQNIKPLAVYANQDYEPYARERDDEVAQLLSKNEIAFNSYKDQVIFEKAEVMKSDGMPYTIFTPYSRKWKEMLTPYYLKSYAAEKFYRHLKKVAPCYFPSLEEIGFQKTDAAFPERIIKQSVIQHYTEKRNFPSVQGTSRLGLHLRFGTVSIRVLATLAQKKNETWLNELIWRDFYQMILWHFPQVQTRSFKPAYDRINWRNNPEEFQAWCDGRTGYPIVDAGMRELNATGFMHNRVRMIVASFLTKHLLVDWRWGEAYFAKKLLDYDLAANNGGWQWAAGCGCDAAPYFRIFNPQLQTEKFDSRLVYVRRWVPEFATPDYPEPIVDHKQARERAIAKYKQALE